MWARLAAKSRTPSPIAHNPTLMVNFMVDKMFIWTMSDLISAAILFIIAACYLLEKFATTLKQWRCKHPAYIEASSCQGYCSLCDKHLGFIGDVREKYGKENEMSAFNYRRLNGG